MNATADLEFFMCDMCRVYVHRDIFCDHRRACKGPDCQELRKHEAEAIGRELDAEQRRLLVGRCGASMSAVPLERQARLQEAAVRRKVADEHARQLEKEAEHLLRNKKVDDFLASLDEE